MHAEGGVGSPTRSEEPRLTATDRTVELITALATGTIDRLAPVYAIESPVAYTYPDAVRILRVARGEEIALLDALEERGILAAEPVTTVPVCPFCRTYPMRIERVCRECGSTAVRGTSMIHHYRCGNVSPEESYRKSSALVCPKCNHTLRHIGVDYERPSNAWYCTDCASVSDSPLLRYHSLTCGRRVPLDDVVDRELSAYTLSTDGAALISDGSLRAAIEQPHVSDALTGLPGAGALKRALELERMRASRYGTKFSLVHFGITNGDELTQAYGEMVVARVVKTLATIARENLRMVDIVGRSDCYGFQCVLPETDSDGAAVVLKKIAESAEAYMHATGRDAAHRSASVGGEVVSLDPLDRR